MGFPIGYFCSIRSKLLASAQICQLFENELMSTLKKTFCGFSMGKNQYWARRVYDLCVYYMTGTPEGSTESCFKENPGIEPETPGLQGIALIHYTTGASSRGKKKQIMIS